MIENQQVYIVYVADGVQTQWDFPYPYVEASEIELYVEHDGEVSKIDPTLYSFDENTKKVTYPLPLDANFSDSLEPLPPVPQGDSVLLWRNTSITQEEDSSNTNFKSPDVERMVDKLTAICQELSTLLGRTVRYNPVVPDGDMETDALKFVEGINQSMQVAQEAAENAEDAAGLAEQAAAQAQAAEQAVDGAINTHNQDSTAHPSIQQHLGTIDGQIVAIQNTKYAADIDLSINSSTFVVTTNLKDQDGNIIGTAKTIDLPLESVVVSGSYDSTNKKVILTLQNGSTVEFSVADLVAGLQSEITSSNKLSADLVDDTNTIHKFVTASDKTTWNGKQNAISDLETIRSGAAAGATALQPEDAASTYATKEEIEGQYTKSNLVPKVPVAFEKAQVSDFYTVVGSPTITDGVASGFGQESCLISSSNLAKQLETECYARITVGQSTGNYNVFLGFTGGDYPIRYSPSYKFSFYKKNAGGWSEGVTQYAVGNLVDIRYIYKDGYLRLYTKLASADLWTQEMQLAVSSNPIYGVFYFGRNVAVNTQYIAGAIDLNHTYIKANGKYFVPPLSSTIVSVSTMTGATSSAAGASGLVPAPAAGDEAKFLRGDGTWVGSTSSVAWGAISGTLSNQTDLQTALNAKANDSNVVHKTGLETITDVKTTTSDIYLKDTSNSIGTYQSDVWTNNQIQFQDSTGARIGRIQGKFITGTNILEMGLYASNGTSSEAGIRVRSTGETLAPTPETSDNSKKIATTAFVKSQTHLIEPYVNGNSWYNVWEIHNPSTGALIGKWCEQGGITDRNGVGDTVNLLKQMPNTKYQVYMFCKNRQRYAWITSISTTQFKFNAADDNTANNDGEFCWCVKGYLA